MIIEIPDEDSIIKWKYSDRDTNEKWKFAEVSDLIKAYDRIKAIIDSWAVDDDEHELLEQIADIISEEEENEGL